MKIAKDTKNEKAEKLASYCASAQGRAYKALHIEWAPAARTLQRADLVAKMADDIARYFLVNDGLDYNDIKTAADILTDNNAHLARRVLEVIAL